MKLDRPIITALLFFSSLLLVFFLVYPAYGKFQSAQMDLAQKTAQYNSQYEYFSDINKNYEEIQHNSDAIKKIDDALPNSADLGQLVYYLQKKTSDSGLVMRNFSLSQSGKGAAAKVKELTFSLELFGDYASMRNFIDVLEKSDRLFEVASLSFGSANQGTSSLPSQLNSSALFDFSLVIKTHSY